jgi:hypothetical protein
MRMGAHSRETTITRDEEGRWFHDGVPIDQPAIEAAFDRWIDRAPDGRFCLRNSVNWAYVTIIGAPITVRRVSFEAGGEVLLSLSDGRTEALVPRTLRQSTSGEIYCDVREGTMSARFSRQASFALGERFEEDSAGFYLAIGSARVRPPMVSDPVQLASTRSG